MKYFKNIKHLLPALILVFFACQDIQYPEKPEKLIPEQKMVEILVDVHLFNAAKGYDKNTLQENGFSSDAFIYQKYDIDSLQFAQSNTYYGADLNKYGAIYQQVEMRLRSQKKEADTIIFRQNRTQDSIKRVQDSLRLLKIDTTRQIKRDRKLRDLPLPVFN